MEVSVKVACRLTTATDCRHRAITMLLILVEVSVKVACRSTTATDCRHRAITMLLIGNQCYYISSLLIGNQCYYISSTSSWASGMHSFFVTIVVITLIANPPWVAYPPPPPMPHIMPWIEYLYTAWHEYHPINIYSVWYRYRQHRDYIDREYIDRDYRTMIPIWYQVADEYHALVS